MTKNKDIIQPANESLLTEVDGKLTVNENCGSFLTLINKAQYVKLREEAATVKADDAILITAIYKEFAVGETVTGIFTGLDGITPKTTNELTGEVETKFCQSVQWMGSDGKLYQCAGVALVNQFYNQDTQEYKIPVGSKISITHTGKSNRTKLYEVGIIVE